jgi:hypothetical protein
MKHCYLLFAALLLGWCEAHAFAHSAGGTITFHGAVVRETSLPSPAGAYNPAGLAGAATVLPLNEACARLSSDVLDYFATYAHHDAKLVSVTYK